MNIRRPKEGLEEAAIKGGKRMIAAAPEDPYQDLDDFADLISAISLGVGGGISPPTSFKKQPKRALQLHQRSSRRNQVFARRNSNSSIVSGVEGSPLFAGVRKGAQQVPGNLPGESPGHRRFSLYNKASNNNRLGHQGHSKAANGLLGVTEEVTPENNVIEGNLNSLQLSGFSPVNTYGYRAKRSPGTWQIPTNY